MKIFIAGGTSGIGLALAKKYLSLGNKVAVCGRDIKKINSLKNIKNLSVYQVDIYDKESFLNAVLDFSDGDLDMLISVAGVYANSRIKKLTLKEIITMLKTNIIGTLNSFEIARELMTKKQKGQIVAISSVAGLINYPRASLYSNTKRTVISICDSYREALKDFNIAVTTVIPGYIDTEKLRELNNGDVSRKPFIISEDKAVEIIFKAIEEKKEKIIFPLKMKVAINFLALLPKKMLSLILIGKKGEE